jgi:MFS family permease
MAEARATAKTPRGLGEWGRTFTALRERDYAVYFGGNLAFFMAMQMNQLLRGFLAFEITGSATALGLVALAVALPMLFVSPFGGVIADRYDKRKLLLATQGLVALVNVVLAVLIFADLIEFWHLLISALFLGLTISLAMPARNALVPQLIPQHKLMNAVSLQMGGMNLTRIVGPALAGVLIAPLGLGTVWSVSVVLYVVGMLTILLLPRHGMASGGQGDRFMTELVDGFRYVVSAPTIRLLLLAGLMMPLFAFPVQLVLPVFAGEDVYDVGGAGLGIMMAAAGFGGLAGALISTTLDHWPLKGRIMLAGAVLQGALFIAFALTPVFAAAVVFLAVGNIGGMLFMTSNNSVIQTEVPERYRGRVLSMLMMSFGAMPLGVLPLTVLSDLIGPQASVAGAMVIMVVSLLLFFLLSDQLRNLRVVPGREAELSPAQAAAAVAEGRLTREEADRLMRGGDSDAGQPEPAPVPVAAAAVAEAAQSNGRSRPVA